MGTETKSIKEKENIKMEKTGMIEKEITTTENLIERKKEDIIKITKEEKEIMKKHKKDKPFQILTL